MKAKKMILTMLALCMSAVVLTAQTTACTAKCEKAKTEKKECAKDSTKACCKAEKKECCKGEKKACCKADDKSKCQQGKTASKGKANPKKK